MVDTKGSKEIEKYANRTRIAVELGQWKEATALWSSTESVIMRTAGNIDFYNILNSVSSSRKLVSYPDARARALGNKRRGIYHFNEVLLQIN